MKKKNRPKISVKLSRIDILFEILGVVCLFGLWLIPTLYYPDLPETIPTHFDGKGNPDAYGGRLSIFEMPVIATVLFVGLTVLNRFPHIFNYPVEITAENAPRQYQMATEMIRLLNLSMVLIFGFITWQTIQTALGNAEGLGKWVIPGVMVATLIPIIRYALKSSAEK